MKRYDVSAKVKRAVKDATDDIADYKTTFRYADAMLEFIKALDYDNFREGLITISIIDEKDQYCDTTTN